MPVRLLDLYCGAGGAAKGYADAGFEVVGVDRNAQPNFPFEFHRGDALEYLERHGREFDAIHASPPCQRYTSMQNRWGRQEEHADLVPATRDALIALGIPWVLENVEGAPMQHPLLLCGSMFGLGTAFGAYLRRHRLFDSSILILSPGRCEHRKGNIVLPNPLNPDRPRILRPAVAVYGESGPGVYSSRDGTHGYAIDERREAMGIDWMTSKELSQAIPPAYTRYIGGFLREAVEGRIAERSAASCP